MRAATTSWITGYSLWSRAGPPYRRRFEAHSCHLGASFPVAASGLLVGRLGPYPS